MRNFKSFTTLSELDSFCQKVCDGECQFSDSRLDEQVTLAKTILSLTTLFGNPFPLAIEHRDRPDFLITFNQTLVAIEVVRVIAKSRAHAISTARKCGVGLLYSRYGFSAPIMSRYAMEESISTPCTGIDDFEPTFNEEYVDAFIGLVNEKKKKILQNADCCIVGADTWLLIKDEHRLGISQADFVVRRVQAKMCHHWSNSPRFSRIIYVTSSKLFVLDGDKEVSSLV